MYLQKYLHYVKMIITRKKHLNWDKGNVNKNKKHGIKKSDIEIFFRSKVYISDDLKHSSSEKRFIAIGKGPLGKHMIVIFTLRKGAIRPISARHMNKREIEKYEKEITKI
jgi:uncharacterized protein